MNGGLARAIACAIVCAGGLLPSSDAAAEQKVAFVDPQRVINSSNEGKQIVEKLQSIQKEKQAQISKREKEFTDAQQDFQNQISLLTPEKLEERQLELQKLKGKLQREAEVAQEELLLEQQRLFGPLRRRIEKEIQAVGEVDGFTIILAPHQGVVYFDGTVDITDKVIARINK